MRRLPLPPVKQRAADDVEVEVYDDDRNVTEVHYYRPGAAEYLTTRYHAHPRDSGLRWQVTEKRT